MARSKSGDDGSGEGVISIVGPDMEITGDLKTEATVRVEGRVEGDIEAGKAVVVGKDGVVEGNIHTQDAIVSGRVEGRIAAASRLEVKATARIDGDVHARRVQLDEGALLNGTIQMSDEGPPEPGERRETGTGSGEATPGGEDTLPDGSVRRSSPS